MRESSDLSSLLPVVLFTFALELLVELLALPEIFVADSFYV
jgi:hypothetical protein